MLTVQHHVTMQSKNGLPTVLPTYAFILSHYQHIMAPEHHHKLFRGWPHLHALSTGIALDQAVQPIQTMQQQTPSNNTAKPPMPHSWHQE